jgi:filamentous hemagglutinin family protein
MPKTPAQIIPDTTLPTNSIVTPDGSTTVITGGTTTGNYLFHSFDQFSLSTGNTAFFNHALTIDNIITRVTGGSISNIDGIISANGTANLFLLNPNGIVFGPNASLNIGGSFLGTTANRITFGDGSEFSATDPNAPPLLTVNVPIGLQFDSSAGSIQVQGPGNNVVPDFSTGLPNRDNRPPGLQVNPGQTLALLGGEVALTGGNVTAEAGRVELWSVSNGELSVNIDGSQISVNSQPTTEFTDINLTQAASIDTSGNRSGEIQMQGRQIRFADGSLILAFTQGNEAGGNVNIRATESLELTGTSAITPITSALFSEVTPGATGTGGDLTIETDRLLVNDGAQIALGTFGFGDAGDVVIKANSVEVIGISPDTGPSGLISSSASEGNGGNLTIETSSLSVADGAQVFTGTSGSGNSGSLTVNAADSVEVIGASPFGPSGLSTQVDRLPAATGSGGNLTIETNRLLVTEGGQVSAATASLGDAGNMTVRANQVEVIGESVLSPSGFFSSSEGSTEKSGTGGDVLIQTNSLLVADGGQIVASTGGPGDAGSLTVEAEQVELVGRGSQGSSGLFASAIIRQNQQIDPSALPSDFDPSTLDPSSLPPGFDPSSIDPNALPSDFDPSSMDPNALPPGFDPSSIDPNALPPGFDPSSIDANAVPSDIAVDSTALSSTNDTDGNNGGSITINTDRLIVRDGATISVSNFPSNENSTTADPGTGAAGNIVIDASSLVFLNNEGLLTADTQQGNNANITVTSPDIVLRRGSKITTNSTELADGGNITLTMDNLVGLENSDITANAEVLNGGQVIINAEALFGIQFREQLTPDSDITATGGSQGVAGTVEINTPEVDPAAGLIELQGSPIDVTALLGDDLCSPEVLANSSFIITGRGGIPPTPTEPLSYEPVALEWARPDTSFSAGSANFSYGRMSLPVNSSIMTRQKSQIIEAQGWIVTADGTIILTAESTTVTPDGWGFTHPGCR